MGSKIIQFRKQKKRKSQSSSQEILKLSHDITAFNLVSKFHIIVFRNLRPEHVIVLLLQSPETADLLLLQPTAKP